MERRNAGTKSSKVYTPFVEIDLDLEDRVVEMPSKALIDEIKAGNVEKVRSIVARARNPRELVNSKDELDNTPLFFAANLSSEKTALEIVRFLIENGAHQKDSNFYGEQPMHVYARSGKSSVLRLLYRHGGKINCTDLPGNTPLMHAIKVQSLPSVKFLVEKQANLTANEKDDDPMTLVVRTGNIRIVQCLFEGYPMKAVERKKFIYLEASKKRIAKWRNYSIFFTSR
eukprot:TRINITY_DN24477_c0_g1_i1.p1 TRINITY_DN24477_c0_g1~~TRINITY_DN24477_c0_g1_i1.p1  ORF type:complete len:228 (-),score=24.93 TRINITY_DN24477_c0_g1_i1:61-744(-)